MRYKKVYDVNSSVSVDLMNSTDHRGGGVEAAKPKRWSGAKVPVESALGVEWLTGDDNDIVLEVVNTNTTVALIWENVYDIIDLSWEEWEKEFYDEAIKNLSFSYFGDGKGNWGDGFYVSQLSRRIASGYDALKETWDFMNINRDLVKGKHVLVVGSEKPWIELSVLAIGEAWKVTTVDYRVPSVKEPHPQQRLVEYNDWLAETNGEQYDIAITYSSIEHWGLGRYGDQLDPWADIRTLSQVYCRLKPRWHLFVGPNCPYTCGFRPQFKLVDGKKVQIDEPKEKRSQIYMNWGRDYSVPGLARLFMSYEFDEERTTKEFAKGYFSLRKPW